MVSFTMSGDASKITSTTPLDVKGVSYSYDQKTGCLYDYIRIPGGSEDGSTHTSRDRFLSDLIWDTCSRILTVFSKLGFAALH